MGNAKCEIKFEMRFVKDGPTTPQMRAESEHL